MNKNFSSTSWVSPAIEQPAWQHMFPQHWWRTHWSSRQHQDAPGGRWGGSWRSTYTTLDRFPYLARWWCCYWCCEFIACATWWPRQRCSGECQACHGGSSRCSRPLVQKVLEAWYKEDIVSPLQERCWICCIEGKGRRLAMRVQKFCQIWWFIRASAGCYNLGGPFLIRSLKVLIWVQFTLYPALAK